METIVILQGVCVSVTDPLPSKRRKDVVESVLTLDVVTGGTAKVSTMPVVFRNKYALAVKRDIVPGDIVTVNARPTLVGGMGKGSVVIYGFDARVERSVNYGMAFGCLTYDIPAPKQMFSSNPDIVWSTFRLDTSEGVANPTSLTFEIFGNLATMYSKSFRRGMMLLVQYRLQAYTQKGEQKVRLVVTHASEVKSMAREEIRSRPTDVPD